MNPWHNVLPGDSAPETVDCIIEIPRGSRLKYELDKNTGLLRLDRVLYSAVFYPANYGFIPRTYCDDHDPLDILVLGHEPVVPMCILTARPIGVMQMVDQNEEDDKIIAIHEHDPAVAHFRDIEQLPAHTLNELERFFSDYKILEKKVVRIERFQGLAAAHDIINKSLKLYTDSFHADGSKRADAPVLRSDQAKAKQADPRSPSLAARVEAARRQASKTSHSSVAPEEARPANGEAAKSEAAKSETAHSDSAQGTSADQPLEFVPNPRPSIAPIAFDLRTLQSHAPRESAAPRDFGTPTSDSAAPPASAPAPAAAGAAQSAPPILGEFEITPTTPDVSGAPVPAVLADETAATVEHARLSDTKASQLDSNGTV
jgi:inorganic pyrophosphatase